MKYKTEIDKRGFSLLFVFFLFLVISSKAQFVLNGSANKVGASQYQLTPDQLSQSGSMWWSKQVSLNNSFDLRFKLNFGSSDFNGADGIVFVLQQQSVNAGSVGHGIGYEGIKPSVAVEFDTYENNVPGEYLNDPIYDHIGILKNGVVDHASANALTSPVQCSATDANVEDGKDHLVRLIWNANTKKLEVYFDCVFRTSYTGDIVANVFNNNPNVYWGFTSATGGCSNDQRVSFVDMSFLPINQPILCAGASANLDLNTSSNVKWWPNYNISSTSVPNPTVWPAQSTWYHYSIDKGCGDFYEDSMFVKVNQPAKHEIDAPSKSDFCAYDPPVFLKAKLSSPSTTWWSIPSGAISKNGEFDPAKAVVGKTRIYYGTSGACGDSVSVDLNVRAVKNPSIVPFGPLCIGNDSVKMQAIDKGVWTIDGLANSGVFNPKNMSAQVHRVIHSINDFCPVSDTLDVLVKTSAVTRFIADKRDGCTPLQVNFTDISDSIAKQSTWYFTLNGQTVDSIKSPLNSFVFNNGGCYGVTLKNTYNNGCVIEQEVANVVCAKQRLVANFSFANSPMNLTNQNVNVINQSQFATSYQWKFPEANPEKSTEVNASVLYQATVQDTFLITLIAANGDCIDSITKRVIMKEAFKIYVPKAFTPNGDGINELFFPQGLNIVSEDYDFSIFNRWGELIFDSKTPYEGWNGRKFNTMQEVQEDVYVWRLQVRDYATNQMQVILGEVTVLK